MGDNTALTTLALHGNEGLTRTTATLNLTTPGVYVLGNSALENIDIADSYFDHIGQDHSLQGLTAVKKLKANNNRFVTFTNSNYDITDSYGNSRVKSIVSGKPSLEDLTGLEELDLRHNLLADSVHLWRNTALKRLDLSHNQQLSDLPESDAAKQDKRKEKAAQILKYGDHYVNASGNNVSKSIGTAVTVTDAIMANNKNRANGYPFELRDCDLRDTVGIYHLDLNFNRELEYVNVANTALRNTASDYTYMVPGWESDGSYAHGKSVPHSFIWMQPATKVKVVHIDNTNLQSNGFMYYPELDTLTQAGMYGDCEFMGGSINMSGTVRKWTGQTISLVSGKLKAVTTYVGGDGKTWDGKNPYDNPIRYWDVRYSSYDSIGTNAGVNLERIYADGNPIATFNVSPNKKIIDAYARACSVATVVDAHDLPSIVTLDLSTIDETAMAVKHIFAGNDPSLPQITNLAGLADLELLYLYNDQLMGRTGKIAVGDNKKLQSLWVSNCDLSSLNLEQNSRLDSLRCYDNLPLDELVVTHNTALRYLDVARCAVERLNLGSNSALNYLDCSNDASTGHNLLVDLDLTANNAITTVHADRNDLHAITGLASKTSLATLTFAHNHVNAIDLSGCSALTASSVDASDNGRTIEAECASVKTSVAASGKLYYFQLDSSSPDMLAGGSATFIGGKTSTTSTAHHRLEAGAIRELGSDNFTVGNIDVWTGNAWPYVPASNNAPRHARPDTDALDGSQIKGSIVVLDEDNRQATYTYNTGNDAVGAVEFYLNWSAPGVVTAINAIDADREVASVTYYNPAGMAAGEPHDGVNIVVTTYTDGSRTTTKVVY